jgi:hypothetical protein
MSVLCRAGGILRSSWQVLDQGKQVWATWRQYATEPSSEGREQPPDPFSSNLTDNAKEELDKLINRRVASVDEDASDWVDVCPTSIRLGAKTKRSLWGCDRL